MLSHYEVRVDISGCGQSHVTILTSHRWSLEIHHLCKGTLNSLVNRLINGFCDVLRLAWSVKQDSANPYCFTGFHGNASLWMKVTGWRIPPLSSMACWNRSVHFSMSLVHSSPKVGLSCQSTITLRSLISRPSPHQRGKGVCSDITTFLYLHGISPAQSDWLMW